MHNNYDKPEIIKRLKSLMKIKPRKTDNSYRSQKNTKV